MELLDKTIDLDFSRAYFEEIYFKDDQANIFYGPTVKLAFIYFVTALLLFISAIIYSLLTNKSAWLIMVLLMFLLLALTNFYLRSSAIVKWRRTISRYLNTLSKIKQHKLVLSATTLTMIEDDVETVVKWSSFSKLVIDQNHLSLSGTENFLFPKKSMLVDDYNSMVEIARSQIKNDL